MCYKITLSTTLKPKVELLMSNDPSYFHLYGHVMSINIIVSGLEQLMTGTVYRQTS